MRLVLVTGMHRSGTSLAARVLNLLGVDLGPAEAMMAATEDNPQGYWEAEAISALNDELLEELGGRWHRLPPLPEGWEHARELAPFRKRGRQLLDDLFGDREVAGFKDPRASVTLPFWRTIVDVHGSVLLLRDPAEVADSVNKRDGLAPEHAAGLWIDHTVGAYVNDPDRHLLTYDELLADPVDAAVRMAGWFDLPEPDADTRARIEAFADPALRRAEGFSGGDGPEMAAARTLHELLTSPLGDQLEPLLASLYRGRTSLRAWHREADEPAAIPELRATVDRLNREVRQLGGQLQQARRDLSRRTNELQQARDRADRWQGEYARLRNRRVVKAALGAVEPLRPVVRKVRQLTATGAGPGDGGRPRQRHTPATPEAARQLAETLARTAPGSQRTEGPLVSICVLNRNGEGHLRRLLPQLRRTTYRSFELILVDNASDDGSVAYVERFDADFPVRVLRNRENRSFSDGNNQAVEASGGELVLLLNNDIEPAAPGWLGHLVDTLEERDAAAVGARLVYPRRPGLVDNAGDVIHPDLTLQHRGIHFDGGDDGIPRGRNLGSGEDPTTPTAAAVTEVPGVTAACVLLRRAAWDAVGGLTSGYRYGTEDVDLCLKLRERGGPIVYDGQAVLWHHEYGTQNEAGRERKRRNRIHNRQLFVDRWGPRIFRTVLADRIRGDRAWSYEPLHVAITLTKDDPAGGYGDYYTAHELGDALLDLGWRVSYVERYDDRWYDLDGSVDVIVVLLDAFELPRIPRHVVSVAWVRNWTDRWIARPWFDDYDVVLASSRTSRDLIEDQAAKRAHLFPLATNPDRFQPREPDPVLRSEALFVGNHWGEPRGIVAAIGELPAGVDLRIHGSGWEDVRAAAPYAHGPIDYERLPAAYSSADVVIDDTASHTKPYGAVNSRVFDALAAGALVVSDNVHGVRELFGDDFPTWGSGSELGRRMREYHDDPERFRTIADRLRQQVLEQHTYAHRARELRDILLGWCDGRRVGIAIGVPRREVVDEWGDYHFARDLQRELELAGHPTTVDLLPEWDEHRTGRHDVVLHLFGLSELRTRPGQLSVLWNISHPDRVSAALVERYDLAFVASDRFAATLAEKVDVPVLPLHQATATRRFRPEPGGPHHELLFVANSRKVRRRIIDDLTAGGPLRHDLAIYGTNWTADLVDPVHVRGEHVPNRELPRYYAAADIVLNDHWDDMREHGFLSNRLYDALACGAFVVSDHVDGIEDEFDGAVVTYRDAADLHATIDHFLAHPDERAALAQRGRAAVLDRHGFDRRCGELLAAVTPRLAERPAGVVTSD